MGSWLSLIHCWKKLKNRAAGFPDPPQSFRLSTDSSVGNSVCTTEDDDESWMTEEQKRMANVARAALAAHPDPELPMSFTVLASAPPRTAIRVPLSEVDPAARSGVAAGTLTVVPAKETSKKSTKAVASSRAPADQLTGAKAPTPTKGQVKGQESPVVKATHPRASSTQSVSGAGSLRGKAGSGEIGAVCGSSSPARKPGS
jgi:hypothetical protein